MKNYFKKGQTILELLVILSIISILFFSVKLNTQSYNLELLGIRIRSMFFLARSLSIYTGRTYGIYFNEFTIELYDADQLPTVNIKGIKSGKNRLVNTINLRKYNNISYGIISENIPDPNNNNSNNIPNYQKPIKMGNQNIMHIRPTGGITNGSVYFMDHDKTSMICIRTAFAHTRLFLYYYNHGTGKWERLR